MGVQPCVFELGSNSYDCDTHLNLESNGCVYDDHFNLGSKDIAHDGRLDLESNNDQHDRHVDLFSQRYPSAPIEHWTYSDNSIINRLRKVENAGMMTRNRAPRPPPLGLSALFLPSSNTPPTFSDSGSSGSLSIPPASLPEDCPCPCGSFRGSCVALTLPPSPLHYVMPSADNGTPQHLFLEDAQQFEDMKKTQLDQTLCDLKKRLDRLKDTEVVPRCLCPWLELQSSPIIVTDDDCPSPYDGLAYQPELETAMSSAPKVYVSVDDLCDTDATRPNKFMSDPEQLKRPVLPSNCSSCTLTHNLPHEFFNIHKLPLPSDTKAPQELPGSHTAQTLRCRAVVCFQTPASSCTDTLYFQGSHDACFDDNSNRKRSREDDHVRNDGTRLKRRH